MAAIYNDYSVFEKIGLADEPVGVKFSFFRPENVRDSELIRQQSANRRWSLQNSAGKA